MKIDHPLRIGSYPIQQVLRDLASQENCDGSPYDQMVSAAEYIDLLEKKVKELEISSECYLHGMEASNNRLKQIFREQQS